MSGLPGARISHKERLKWDLELYITGTKTAKWCLFRGYSKWADEKVIDSIQAGQEFSFELKQDDMIAHWWMMWKLGLFDHWNNGSRTSQWLWHHQSVFAVGFMRRLHGIFGIRALGLYTACDPLLSIYTKARFTNGGMYYEWLTKIHGREHAGPSIAEAFEEMRNHKNEIQET